MSSIDNNIILEFLNLLFSLVLVFVDKFPVKSLKASHSFFAIQCVIMFSDSRIVYYLTSVDFFTQYVSL